METVTYTVDDMVDGSRVSRQAELLFTLVLGGGVCQRLTGLRTDLRHVPHLQEGNIHSMALTTREDIKKYDFYEKIKALIRKALLEHKLAG